VSLTIDEKILGEIDKNVDGIRLRSRSDAIEKILKDHLLERKTAVILAGGNPEKLFIKELGTYRPLVSIGKNKLIEHIVLKCREGGFSNIVIIGQTQLVSKIYEVLGNGSKHDVNITYIEENKELGSGKTLELAKHYAKSDFLFLPCDHWFDFDLKKLNDFHKTNDAITTLAVHARTSFDWKTSIVEMEGYRIVNYEEFPKKPKTHLVSVFIGFMSPEIFNNVPPGEVFWSLQEHVFPKLAKEGKLVGYPVAGHWVNVHTRSDVEKIIELSKR
jgi:mannose-1-phosphate guanylyltransferase